MQIQMTELKAAWERKQKRNGSVGFLTNSLRIGSRRFDNFESYIVEKIKNVGDLRSTFLDENIDALATGCAVLEAVEIVNS